MYELRDDIEALASGGGKRGGVNDPLISRMPHYSSDKLRLLKIQRVIIFQHVITDDGK